MEIVYLERDTGAEIKSTIKELETDFLDNLSSFGLTEKIIKDKIDSLSVSADAKALLNSLNKFTFTVGKAVIKIGKKIIDVIFSLLKNFPYLGFGVIFGLVLGALISAIPLIGAALSSLATAIAVTIGVTLGLREEYRSSDLRDRIDNFINDLSPLRK